MDDDRNRDLGVEGPCEIGDSLADGGGSPDPVARVDEHCRDVVSDGLDDDSVVHLDRSGHDADVVGKYELGCFVSQRAYEVAQPDEVCHDEGADPWPRHGGISSPRAIEVGSQTLSRYLEQPLLARKPLESVSA